MHDKSSPEDLQIESLTSCYGLTQVINEITDLLLNSSSCNDLIFTWQPNLMTYSVAYSFLHNNCHHQITLANLVYTLCTHHPTNVY